MASPPKWYPDMHNLHKALSVNSRFDLSWVGWMERHFKTVPEATATHGLGPQLVPVCVLALLAMTVHCRETSAQGFEGFGGTKTTVTLERKLPAAIQLPGTAFDIRMAAHGPADSDVGGGLTNLLSVELQKDDNRLHSDPNSPDEIISCSVLAYQTPPPISYVRQETVFQKGHAVQVAVPYYKVTGLLTITYQVSDARKRTLDAGTITGNYSREFQAGTNAATDESVSSRLTNPFKRMAGKKTDETIGPPTKLELQQLLIDRVVSQLAPRIVNTDEKIEVMLARGKPFDEANKLAVKDQWTRYLETLETMPPLSSPEDDVYRLYDIGVANEALAYEAPDRASVQKFLNQAAIDYGKAIDGKPSEKYFIDPQTRIEMAVAHYRKLSQGASTSTADRTSSGNENNTTGSASNLAPVKASSTSAINGDTRGSANSSAPAGGDTSSSVLTNIGVIKMAKAGVDEDSIISAIHDAQTVRFDLSPDGLINLANNGVKGKIVSAMRERSRPAVHHAASAPSRTK